MADEVLGGVDASIPMNVSDSGSSDKGTEFSIPDEYKDKGYVKDLKSFEDVWKKLDGSQQVLGKKAVPDESSTQEDWDAHYKSIGRPEEASKYTFNREGFDKGFLEQTTNEEFDNSMKGIFLKAGLSQRQVNILQPETEKLMQDIYLKNAQTKGAQDKEFDELVDKTFGANKDQILTDAKKLLEENTPAGFGEHIKELPNEQLVVLAGVLNSFKQKYINEDSLDNSNKNNLNSGETADSLREKAKEIMISKEYRDEFDPLHESKKKEVEELYVRIAELI